MATGTSEATQDIQSYLRSLVLYCARKNASAWRELWDGWPYSEVLEYYVALLEDQNDETSELNSIDWKNYEHVSSVLLRLIYSKL